MKKIAITLFIGLIISTFSTVLNAQETNDNVFLTKTNTVENADIPELHNRAWDWVQNYYNTADLKVVSKDLDEDKISADVEVSLKGMSNSLTYTVTIDLKNNEYTFTISSANNTTDAVATKHFTDLSNRIERAMVTGFTPDAKAKLNK